ncbi:hypothetical protein [Kitasatospora sp. NPDC047058]|uniref:hypothetical protein n=1 Tax=Kitasatospora sp. NPDC047058 TaxID=3155620 RepID=UPI0034044CF4
MSATHSPRDTEVSNRPPRANPAVHRMLTGPALTPAHLSMVLLVVDEQAVDGPMPTTTVDRLPTVMRDCSRLGIPSVKIFAQATARDATGSVSLASDSLMARAVRVAKNAAPEVAVMTETCLCSYTPGGLCYVTDQRGRPDVAATIEVTAQQAVAHADAGADIIGPASMVLGTTRAARDALDQSGYEDRSVMPHVIYHSSLYDGFRLTMGATPHAGADRAFQISPTRPSEFISAALRLVEDGADLLLLEPALFTGDMVRDLRARTTTPLFPFSVSGEYNKLAPLDPGTGRRDVRTLAELCTTLRRAGATATVTYGAVEIARQLNS